MGTGQELTVEDVMKGSEESKYAQKKTSQTNQLEEKGGTEYVLQTNRTTPTLLDTEIRRDKTRFEEIAQFLHFSDPNNEPQRGDADYDRLFKVRPVLSDVLKSIQQTYEPSKDMSVNEGMIAFKGRLGFRQYMPAKPTKYGIKVWMAADPNNGYVCNYKVYLGQENRQRVHGLCYDVVMDMAKPFLNSYRHIFCDTFFTTVRLFDYLIKKPMHAGLCA
ncbi:piggyBac transposable element-derived protein 4-like [Nematostella vectensis]|uniref:piggyBac transposable element-derived protein 4-like n=1 Tax=Nematostella vectensis TaxID=45351 RepID=UPI0013902ED6|nr:piggyBac transposable element-derived protein 4-like [Nematostella vectensis]